MPIQIKDMFWIRNDTNQYLFPYLHDKQKVPIKMSNTLSFFQNIKSF